MKRSTAVGEYLVAFGVVLLAAGCGPSTSDTQNAQTPPPPDPAIEAARVAREDSLAAKTFVFDCEKNLRFTVRVAQHRAWLHLPGKDPLALPHVEAASGARYAKGDVAFWNQGDGARLEIGSEVYTACRVNPEVGVWEDARLRGVTFRATGNEPAWSLEISGRRGMVLVTDLGKAVHRFQDVDVLSEGDSLTTWIGKSGTEALTVRLRPGSCKDSMSGTEFDTRVSARLNDVEYTGCGRNLR